MNARPLLSPIPGYWLIRLNSRGPRVPAAIEWHETIVDPDFPENDMRGTRYRYLAATINGEPASLDDVWLSKGSAITAAEYRFRTAESRWAKKYAPDEPIANPRKPVDLNQIPLLL